MFPGVLHVLYGCLIIPVIRTLPHAFKISVSLFHTFIIWKNNPRIRSTRYRPYDLEKIRRRRQPHVPLKHTTSVVTRLHTRPMASVIALVDRSGDSQSRDAEVIVIICLTRRYAPSTASSLLAHVSQCLANCIRDLANR